MAAPVILITQSVPEGLQWRPMEFQPYARNSPTSWSSSPLPSGISLNTLTGKVSGTPTTPGVSNFALVATNADGDSAPQVFCMGVEASAASQGTDVDLGWDVLTGRVTPSGGIPPEGAAAFDPLAPVMWLRTGNTRIVNVRLVKNGATLAVSASVAKLGMKADDDDVVLQESDGFFQTGTGESARIRISLPVTDALLTGAVNDGEEDDGERTVRARLKALCDLRIVYANPDTATIGPANLELNSGTFVAEVTRRIES